MPSAPSTIFGANLRRHFLDSYSGGVWTDANLTQDGAQINSGLQPAATTLGMRRGLSFDGTDDGLETGTTDISAGPLTVGFLFRSSTTPGADAYVMGHGGFSGFAWGVAVRSTGKIGMSNDASTYAESDATVCDGVLRSVICTIGTTGGIIVYVDGVAQTTTQPGVTAVFTGVTDSIGIGALVNSAGNVTAAPVTAEIAGLFAAEQEATAAEALALHRYLFAFAYPMAGTTGVQRTRPADVPAVRTRALRSPAVIAAAPYTPYGLATTPLRHRRQPPVPLPLAPPRLVTSTPAPTWYAVTPYQVVRPVPAQAIAQPMAPQTPPAATAPTWYALTAPPAMRPAVSEPTAQPMAPPAPLSVFCGQAGGVPEATVPVVRLPGPMAPALSAMVASSVGAMAWSRMLPPRAARAVASGALAPTYVLIVPVVPVYVVRLVSYGRVREDLSMDGQASARLVSSGQTRAALETEA